MLKRDIPLEVTTMKDIQNQDKTLTYTHCRFEAKTIYGLGTMLVVDADEFLNCPFAESTVSLLMLCRY